jgi:hypothetical protein
MEGDEKSSIEVCGNTCVFDIEKSNAGETTCTLDRLISEYSYNDYNLVKSTVLQGTWTGTGNQDNLNKLNDGVYTVDYSDDSNNCEIVFEAARDGYVYALEEVRFYVNGISRNMPHTGNLIFQGFDGEEWYDIWEVDSGVHKGWNSMEISDIVDNFRFYGQTRGACAVGEVQVKGFEVYNSQDTEVTCQPKLTLGGETEELQSDIVYTVDSTPVLNGMNKRYGTVLGGDEIEFTGYLFDQGTATVAIDNRSCAVSTQAFTTITCTTDTKPDSEEDPTLKINIEGMGNAVTGDKIYRYVKKWSDTITWGGFPPSEGDAVNIPKGMHLLVDIPKTPKLSFVNVDGSLIFD